MFFNDSQLRAVDHFDGPCLCLAGPGSGKTAVIIERIHRLINKGVNPEKICVITFTKAAAKEMQSRFNESENFGKNVTFGTFHSLFWGILSKELKLNYDDILMGTKRSSLIKEAIEKAGFEKEAEVLIHVEREISFIKNNDLKVEDYRSAILENDKLKNAYYEYEGLKRKYNLYDFDDMLTSTYQLFLSKPEILERWQHRFDYFLIDEMQDMNGIQFKLISLMSGINNNLFMVGDEDQSIYGFRGAKPQMINDLDKVYSNLKQIILNINYRCPQAVLDAALCLINNNKTRFPKEIKGNKAGGVIEVIGSTTQVSEAQSIILKIQSLIEQGYSYDQMAVLYRNHANANYLVDALVSNNIPIYLKERMPNIYSHYIIDDIMDYFQIAVGNATRKRMLSVINKPNRYILRQSMEAGYSISDIKRFYRGNQSMELKVEAFERDINLISKMSAFAALNYIRQGMGYENYLIEKALAVGNEPQELIDVINFLGEAIKECKSIEKAIEKISFLKLKVDYENKNREQSPVGKVGLYTMHSSKGLEFDVVFIIGANEGVIPPKKAEGIEEIEAERRLFYVAITRSKEQLFITHINEKNRDRMYPSRFIHELNYSSTKSPKASS